MLGGGSLSDGSDRSEQPRSGVQSHAGWSAPASSSPSGRSSRRGAAPSALLSTGELRGAGVRTVGFAAGSGSLDAPAAPGRSGGAACPAPFARRLSELSLGGAGQPRRRSLRPPRLGLGLALRVALPHPACGRGEPAAAPRPRDGSCAAPPARRRRRGGQPLPGRARDLAASVGPDIRRGACGPARRVGLAAGPPLPPLRRGRLVCAGADSAVRHARWRRDRTVPCADCRQC